MHKRAGEKYYATDLFDGRHWLRNVTLQVSADGFLDRVHRDSEPPPAAEVLRGPVVPGMPNAHSHAFQRAMAGLAETRGNKQNSFWSWREAMYRLASRVGPEDLEAIAAQVFVEMLKAGYTSVCEFHYLHRDPRGAAYADPAEMGRRILSAAANAGIGATLLPVLYQQGGFGGRPLSAHQRRFFLSGEEFQSILQTIAAAVAGNPDQNWGLAFHSLRAVGLEAIEEALADVGQPLHIHIAEQQREVAECVAQFGCPPLTYLTDNLDVGPDWTLIHATHADPGELARVAGCGAVVGLCPTTEANLGDGLFPLEEYLHAGGCLAVGSDSQISLCPREELRWLEYGQRLQARRRVVAASEAEPRCGTGLWRRALDGGARAAGRPLGSLLSGARADWLVIDRESPLLVSADPRDILDILVFSGNQPLVKDVMVGGRWRVRDGRHTMEEPISRRFLEVSRRLNAG